MMRTSVHNGNLLLTVIITNISPNDSKNMGVFVLVLF